MTLLLMCTSPVQYGDGDGEHHAGPAGGGDVLAVQHQVHRHDERGPAGGGH